MSMCLTTDEHSASSPFAPNGPSSDKYDYDERRCLHCQSPSLVTDWAAGDRVCTNCGVVDEGHLRDVRPEWRDFNTDDDRAKGLPCAARGGLVPVDETRYLGGLQPTTLSRHVFGGGSNPFRKRLVSTNRKLDFLMEKEHALALKSAKVSLQVRRRQFQHAVDHSAWDESNNVRPEYEQILLQEEQEAQRSKEALYAEKWSIDRAILIHGQDDEASPHGPMHHDDEVRDDLLKRLDKTLLKASEDLYQAYRVLQSASRNLDLPDRVLHEATTTMCKYAARRDGIKVKGVSSRISSCSKTDSKEASERLRDYNMLKQAAALGSALLFLTARRLGWTRSLTEVCSSFQPDEGVKVGDVFIKPKHCSKAMNEVKAVFPNYGRSAGPVRPNQPEVSDSTANFVQHATRKLELPPVAIASIHTLVQHYRKGQMETEAKSMAKLSSICAAMTMLVCHAGASLQRLAHQAQQTESIRKRQAPDSAPAAKRIKFHQGGLSAESKKSGESSVPSKGLVTDSTNDCNMAFDVFSHAPLDDAASEKKRYEMRRVWYSWSEQMPWSRSIGEIEQSCGVSRHSILTFYKTKLFPRRVALLEVLQERALSKDKDAALNDTPLASVLLKNIATAAALMNNKGQG